MSDSLDISQFPQSKMHAEERLSLHAAIIYAGIMASPVDDIPLGVAIKASINAAQQIIAAAAKAVGE